MMTNAAPMQNPSSAWLVVMGCGAPLLAFAALCFYSAATSPAVDVGGIINFFTFLIGLGAGGGGVVLVLTGLGMHTAQSKR
jgi:hypothetical protein